MAKKTKTESDSIFILKVLLYLILGTIWIATVKDGQIVKIFPIGALVGVLFAQHEHFRIDRKVEYVVLIVAAVLSLSPVFPGLDFIF